MEYINCKNEIIKKDIDWGTSLEMLQGIWLHLNLKFFIDEKFLIISVSFFETAEHHLTPQSIEPVRIYYGLNCIEKFKPEKINWDLLKKKVEQYTTFQVEFGHDDKTYEVDKSEETYNLIKNQITKTLKTLGVNYD